MNLVERCDYLEEQNRQLRAALQGSDDARFPAKWGLSPGEKRILRSLASSVDGFRSRQALQFLTSDKQYDTVKVYVCRLRRKLKPFGVEIHTIYGQGYKIDHSSKSIVLGARTREVAA